MTLCVTVLFCLNKDFFGVKNRFFFFLFCFVFCGGGGWWGGGGGGIPVFLRIFWSGVVGVIDTFVAEHVANMLS